MTFYATKVNKVTRTLVGVMGPGEGATDEDESLAYELGGLIAREGWILVTGGRGVGVMDAASRGARAARGIVIGILPGTDDINMSAAIDIPIITGMNEARNIINVLSCRALFFVGMNAGTASELALTLKFGRPAILIRQHEDVVNVFGEMCSSRLEIAGDPSAAVATAKRILAAR